MVTVEEIDDESDPTEVRETTSCFDTCTDCSRLSTRINHPISRRSLSYPVLRASSQHQYDALSTPGVTWAISCL
jgi:hypothetical protein